MTKYSYTTTSHYYYDATLTQDLLNRYVSTINPANGKATTFTYLNNVGTMSRFTGSRHTPNPEVSHYEYEGSSATPSTVTHEYVNFTEAVNVNFAAAWSAASAFGSGNRIPNGITLADDGTYAANITFANGGITYADGNNTRLTDITYSSGGSVCLGTVYDEGEGSTTRYYATTGQKLNGLRAKLDFEGLYLQTGARASATDIVISRNMRELDIANDSGNHNVENRTGSGTVVDSVTVSGKLDRVHVGSGAVLNMLTVGTQRNFTSADRSAFGYYDSNWASWTYSSATNMEIASGGTATNIYLNNGGSVWVAGPEDRVSSSWNETTQQWDVTTHYASGTGGTLTNLQMAVSGGLVFDGNSDPSATWQNARSVYLNSRDYQSHFLANAPQSAYVEFQSNTVGSNISIGQGGSMRISAGASVTNISMGALVTSTFHTNDGKQMTWVGDRGGKLVIDGGFASNVVVEGANLTRDYYFAAHDHFYTLSSAIQNAYYDSHGSYLDSNVASASATARYKAYQSSRYTEALSNYAYRYVGGEIIVQGGTLLNASGFAYLYANDNPDVTFSSGSAHMSARIGERVSSAVGALSATVEVDGAAHLTSVTVAGGRVVMGANSGGVTRWSNQSNAQSNYALVEYLNLRTSGLEGDNNSAMVLFGGYNGGGQESVPVMSNGSQVYGSWTYYNYDCKDPGEIHYLTADSGLIVRGGGWEAQDFTYTGSGAVTINGLGTVVLSGYHSRACSDSYYGKGPYLSSATKQYYFGVVKGVYDEDTGKLQKATILNGDGGFDWTGTLVVGSGGIVQDVGAKAGLKTANTLTSDSWNPVIENEVSKKLVLVAGGSADNVAVTGRVTNYEITSSSLYKNNAALLVSSGATATNISVLSNGIAMAEGGVINGVFVGNGGLLYLSGWAGAHQVAKDDYGTTLAGPQYLDTTVLNAVRLDSGGQLAATLDWGFRSGGHAPSVIANKGGGIMNGVTANGVAYVSGLDFAGAITLTDGQQALDVTARGFKTITSRDSAGNPTAYTTTIASLNVSSGGIVKNATVGEEGAIYVSEGANVSGLTASGGRLIFENEGSGWGNYLPGSAAVAGISVLDGGILQVNSKFGLTATDMQIGESAGLDVCIVKDADEDHAVTELNGTWKTSWGSGTFRTQNGVLSGFGGQFGYEYRDQLTSSAYTSARLSMTILNGATLSGGDLRGYGYVTARNGGKLLDTRIQGITANIGASGYASGLTAVTESTGSAYDTNIYVYGSGALAEKTVLNGGFLGVDYHGVVDGVTLLAPEGYSGPKGDAKKVGPAELEITGGGTAKNVVASAGLVTLYDGSSKDPGMAAPTLSNADIHSAASLLVNADGVVLAGTLNLGGVVTTTAERYEWVEVEMTDPDTGDVYSDWQKVTKNNAVANASTLTVNFDLTERNSSEEGAMIDNLANLEGATLKSITISADQANGQYLLAQGADGFKGSLTVTCDGKKVGDFTAGTYKQVDDDTVYSLTNKAEVGLCFSVQNTAAAVTDILATVDGKALAKGKWTNKAVTIKTEVNQYSKSIWYKIVKAAQSAAGPWSDAAPAQSDDGWTKLDNTKGITVSEYCEVQFKAKNEKGTDSKIVSYTVNYDATPAVIADFRSDAGSVALTKGTESKVSVTVTDNLDAAPTLELQQNGKWVAVARGNDGRYSFTVNGNGNYSLRATDHAGNVASSVVTVDFYDRSTGKTPAKPTVSADITAPTNKNVTVSAVFAADATVKQYSLDNLQWRSCTGSVVMKNNGTVWFRAGNANGYSASVSYTVSNIDKVAPDAPTASADITAATNKVVTVSAKFSGDTAVKQYSLDKSVWLTYTGAVTMAANGTVWFRGVDAAGNISAVTAYAVKNIRQDYSIKAGGADPTPGTTTEERGALVVTTTPVKLNASGFYLLTGTFAAEDSGTVTVLSNGRKVGSGTVKNGELSFNKGKPVLLDRTDAAEIQVAIKGGSEAGYSVKLEGTRIFSVYDPAGDTPETAQKTGSVTAAGALVGAGRVGFGDEKDFFVFKLESAANLSLDCTATDATKFTLYDSAMKSVVSTSVKAGAAPTTKAKLLNAGTYYLEVRSTNAKKGGDSDFTAKVSASTTFFTKGGDNNDAPETAQKAGAITAAGASLAQGWVGFGDELDYFALTLKTAARLSLDCTATDAAKFILYDGTMKSVLNASVKAGGGASSSKTKLLEAGAYYLAVQSTNAQKGGSADFTVAAGPDTAFFTDGDNSDDSAASAKDLGAVSSVKTLAKGWVGYGDTVDYQSFALKTAARLKFSVNADDAVKLTVYQEVGGTLKQLAKVSVKGGAAETKELLMTEGRCCLAVESTNAKKGGSANYTVALAGGSEFFPKGDNSNDTWQAVSASSAQAVGRKISGWVGFGDAADFVKVKLAGEGRIRLDLNEATAQALAAKQIKVSCLDAAGKTVALALDGGSLLSRKEIAAGEYYLGVSCANVKKFNTSYSITTGFLATA